MQTSDFVGREKELAIIRDVVRHHGILVLTGAGGIGKTTVIEQALDGSSLIELQGLNLIDYEECIARFAEILGSQPEQTNNASVDHWLRESLANFSQDSKPLLWDDFHLADERFVAVLLHALRTTLLSVPFFLVGRPIRLPENLLSHRIRHLKLEALSPADVSLFASKYERSEKELPTSVFGHPYLMKVFFLDGLTRLEDWHRNQLSQHTAIERRSLVRHVLAHTDLQRVWARGNLGNREIDKLHASGVLTHHGRVPEMTVDVLKAHVPQADWGEEEKDLLRYLLERNSLGQRDLVRISELCSRYPEVASVEKYLEDLPSELMSDAQLASMQHELDDLVAEDKMPAELALRLYRAQADPAKMQTFLEVHDRLIESESIHERRLAQLSLLRATMFSGLNYFPPIAYDYWTEIEECTVTTPEVKEQIAFLLYNMCFTVDDQAHGDLQDSVIESIQGYVSSEIKRGYMLLDDGFRAGRDFKFDRAVTCFIRSAEIFSYAGKAIHVAVVKRYLMVLYYLCNQDESLQALLDEWTKNQIPRSDAYPLFFKSTLAWQNGDDLSIGAESCALEFSTSHDNHPILPGPYVRDYFAHAQSVILQRESGVPPNTEQVDLFCHLISSFRLFIALGEAAVALAQNCLLHGDAENASRLADAMDKNWKQTQIHVEGIRFLARATTQAVSIEELINAMTPFAMFVSRLVTPYFVVLGARVVIKQGLEISRFVETIETCGMKVRLRGRPLEIVNQCIEGLMTIDGEHERALTRNQVSTYLFEGHATSRKQSSQSALPTACLLRLKSLVDEQWFDSIDFNAFAKSEATASRTLANQFKRCFGKSPKQYQQAKRINEASHLLKDTDWQLTEIAYECGFYDSAQFSRLFRNAVGETPSAFRERQRTRARSFVGLPAIQ
jgi:AraC-like DNA-binding protein